MALLFIKPHANTTSTQKLVQAELQAAGITITKEFDLASEDIDKLRLIDQHYYAIASKAVLQKPDVQPVPPDKFKAQFKRDWADVLAKGEALNAMDALQYFGVDANGLEVLWRQCEKAKNIVKLGGGFYVGFVEDGVKPGRFVFNAFFMQMRNKFTAKGLSIHLYLVQWDPASLPWKRFRGEVLGPTDPSKAPPTSIRGQIFSRWKELGLSSVPDTGDNGVHASASPFEGLCERLNWMQIKNPADDAYGKRVLNAGVSEAVLRAWAVDPQVTVADNSKGSVFDHLEDTDSASCLAKLEKLYALNK